jgi:hypothetical protein
MPLRDHFRPPVLNQVSWEEVHGMWPGTLVQHLRQILPKGYVAGPRVHSGPFLEIDVAAFESDTAPRLTVPDSRSESNVEPWAPPAPSVAVATDLSELDEYEVRIYDATRGRQLVAAIELVSPANKDRAEKRNAFVGKCASLLQRGIAVTILDLVTVRQANLYRELLDFLGESDPSLESAEPDLYAVSLRCFPSDSRSILRTWPQAMLLGQPLPTVPLWLSDRVAIPLDLEVSYENACRDLWING